MLILRNINIPIEFNGEFKEKCSDELKTSPDNIKSVRIIRKSIDARKKHDIHFVYSFEVELCKDEQRIARNCKKAESLQPPVDEKFIPNRNSKTAPLIIGSGPAGLFAALELIEYGYPPIIIERGKSVTDRTADVEHFWQFGTLHLSSNVQFGEGGAGTFSDGKLNTGTNSPFRMKVLKTFVRFGAPEDILFDAEPHIGTDLLRTVVSNIRSYITDNGGKYLFDTTFVNFNTINGNVCSAVVENDGRRYSIACDTIVLAIGHSSRDTFRMLNDNHIYMEPKPFSVGARIEHLQENINKARYGDLFDNPILGAASYKLSAHIGGRGVYTFCMCPGGVVVNSASEENTIVTNGMSYHARNGINANSAVLVGVNVKDFGASDSLAGVRFQQELESKAYRLSGSYMAPSQRFADFIQNKNTTTFGSVLPSCKGGALKSDINKILPNYITDVMKHGITEFASKIKGFADGDAVLTAPETRSSSPVRIVRGDDMQANIAGIYPCGEGAGYAGGITSSAVDGIRTARAIMTKR